MHDVFVLLSAKQTALWMNRRNAVRVAFFHSTLLNTAIGSAEVPFPHLKKDVRPNGGRSLGSNENKQMSG